MSSNETLLTSSPTNNVSRFFTRDNDDDDDDDDDEDDDDDATPLENRLQTRSQRLAPRWTREVRANEGDEIGDLVMRKT